MMCGILTDNSTQKRFPRAQPTAGHSLLIIFQLKECWYLSALGVAPFLGSDSGGLTNSTCLQLRIPYTIFILSPACYNGALV